MNLVIVSKFDVHMSLSINSKLSLSLNSNFSEFIQKLTRIQTHV
jgi:hypothetical protein